MENQTKNIALSQSTFAAKWTDYGLLVKFKLSLTVVLTSVIAFWICGGRGIYESVMLFVGGFLVTGAANAINEVLEKDYDAQMTRTANRPVATGRMKASEAILFAGLACLAGISILALFNVLTAFLGMLSFLLYAFVYTPLKRYSTIAVAIGAIPGALPVLIGGTAASGVITSLALFLFFAQFLWQFPHFWSVGFLSFDDYKNAGFKLLPESDGKIDRSLGWYSLYYIGLLFTIFVSLYMMGDISMFAFIVTLSLTAMFGYYCFVFHKQFDKAAARKLLFASIAYMPLVLLTCLMF